MDFRKLNRRTLRAGILLLASIGLMGASIFERDSLRVPREDAHWQQIHLPPSILAVRAELCSTSRQHFIGCYRAARALVSLEELAHLAALIPNWNEDDESFLAGKFRQHRRKALIEFGSLFDQLNREIRMHIPRGEESEAVAYALNRWLTAVDPHARLQPTLWESEQNRGATQIDGGVGLRWKALKGKAVVVKVRSGSPAEGARIRLGDQILAVDGIEFHKVSPRKKRYMLFGEGTMPVRISLLRQGQRLHVSLAPQPHFQSNVEFAVDRHTANIRIHDFRSLQTCRDTGRLLLKAQRHGVKMIHLDLRDNPGGTVEEALCIAGLLLGPSWRFAELRPIPRNLYLFPFEPVAARKQVLTTERAQLTRLPLVVSVNHNTASAAEMLAAALQDHGRALIQGARTFGKGTMQSAVNPWNRSDISLRYSTHLIYRPTGVALHHRGVEPDQMIQKDEESTLILLREENFYPEFPALRGA